MLNRMPIIFALVSAAFVSACTQPLEIPKISDGKPIQAKERKVPPIKFTKLIVRPENEHISHLEVGWFCEPRPRRMNRNREINPAFIEAYSLAISDEFETHGYDLRGKTENLFVKKAESQATLQLAGVVVDLRNNACVVGPLPGGRRDEKGTAYVKVNWKVYDTGVNKVVFEATTEGVGKLEEFETDGSLIFHRAAMAMASRNLLARQEFYDVVMSHR